MIFADGVYPNFGGKIWTCDKCIDNETGFMAGNTRKANFDGAHKKCGGKLFQGQFLTAKVGKTSKLRWGKPLEEKNLTVPYGCPKGPSALLKPVKRYHI